MECANRGAGVCVCVCVETALLSLHHFLVFPLPVHHVTTNSIVLALV